MPDPIGPFSPEAVIDAIEADLLGASLVLGRTDDGVVFRGSDVTWVYTGHRSLSRVLRARFAPDEAEDRVAEVAECFRLWDAPVCWILGPSSFPPHLSDLLADAGFGPPQVWLGLARDVTAPPAEAAPSAGLVRRAVSKEDLALWTHVGDGRESHTPDPATAALFAPENAGGDPRCRYYLAARPGGRPLARGMAHLSDAVVGLHWLTAEPDAADAPAALIGRALADARVTGARLAVCAARGPAVAVATAVGFRPYCQFAVHSWPPPPDAAHA